MLASFRRLSKSTVGTAIMGIILILILVGFAMGDIQSVISGGGFRGSSDTLVKIGSKTVTDRDMSRAMERRLSQARQQNPSADYASIAADWDPLLNAVIDARTVEAFAHKFGSVLSKRLVDAQIANIPGAKGLGGKFTDASYQNFLREQRMTDEEVRMIVSSGLLQQLIIAPVVVNAKAPVGMATPYASILLEGRSGEVAFVPTAAFRQGLNPTSADIDRYYAANQRRYMVPEQRVLRIAKIGPEQVTNVQPSDKEIDDYYKANGATYGSKETRVITQAVAPDQATANAIVQRIRGGQTFAAAAAPAGFTPEDISVGPQTKEQFTATAGANVAGAAFAAAEGATIGPIQTANGWNVVRIDKIEREGGKSLAAARPEIVQKLVADKRKEAIEAIVDKVQDALDGGASFPEAAAAGKLTPIETPPLTASGTSPANAAYKFPADLAPALKSGFELGEGDEPVVDSLPNDGGYVLVAPARVIPAAPAPLASIRDRVTQDWIASQASQRAQQLAQSIASKVGKGSLADASKGAPVAVKVEPVNARRIQLSQFQGQVPPPLAMLFILGEGKSRLVAGGQGEGFYVVKVDKIIPGNALNQPALIGRTQQEMQQALAEEYGAQFTNAMRQTVGVKRNEKAITASKARITSTGS
ncbi:peptidylprolyl isomerase [Sphingomonas daechungensis]|uniref:peptidylprolyl isomerase n=1 Tax=Sphingomonas daechungensis TaxID=1176646 RepID=UPI0031E8A26F